MHVVMSLGGVVDVGPSCLSILESAESATGKYIMHTFKLLRIQCAVVVTAWLLVLISHLETYSCKCSDV